MQLYNTLTRKKEDFTTRDPGMANIYVCGITAYDYCHIGHARSALVFDVLVRFLRSKGIKVQFTRNFTDVDDKIIKRANEESQDWKKIAETYIEAFHEDMDRLGVLRADKEPRATNFIPEIQKICSSLIEQGKAYATPSGDVYFRVREYDRYGKLSGSSLDELRAGERVAPGEEKQDPLDFAIWKAAKPGEPYWESPWGKGRPGWHIECSAMSAENIPLDIHGGGQDLIFPHHENEMAQTEAAYHKDLARFWMHNGFVQINKEKMSKSLMNFKTIREILENYLPETLRFFLLGKHYRSPVDFSFEGLDEAEKAQQRVYAALHEAEGALQRTNWKDKALANDTLQEWESLSSSYDAALEDDLNTALALGHIFSQVRIVNFLLEDKQTRTSSQAKKILISFLENRKKFAAQLGLFERDPQAFLTELRDIRAKRHHLDIGAIETLLQQRSEARANKDYPLSDELRGKLQEIGASVRDTPTGQVWDVELP